VGFRRLVGSALSLGLGIILLLVQPVLAQPPVWMPPTLSVAMTKAQDVWVGLPIDPAAAAQVSELAMAKGMLPPGQSLSHQISPDGSRARP
jgi:hypothetical protein